MKNSKRSFKRCMVVSWKRTKDFCLLALNIFSRWWRKHENGELGLRLQIDLHGTIRRGGREQRGRGCELGDDGSRSRHVRETSEGTIWWPALTFSPNTRTIMLKCGGVFEWSWVFVWYNPSRNDIHYHPSHSFHPCLLFRLSRQTDLLGKKLSIKKAKRFAPCKML